MNVSTAMLTIKYEWLPKGGIVIHTYLIQMIYLNTTFDKIQLRRNMLLLRIEI